MITATVQDLPCQSAVGRFDELCSMVRLDYHDPPPCSSGPSHLRERLVRIIQVLKDPLDTTGIEARIGKIQPVSVATIEFHGQGCLRRPLPCFPNHDRAAVDAYRQASGSHETRESANVI